MRFDKTLKICKLIILVEIPLLILAVVLATINQVTWLLFAAIGIFSTSFTCCMFVSIVAFLSEMKSKGDEQEEASQIDKQQSDENLSTLLANGEKDLNNSGNNFDVSSHGKGKLDGKMGDANENELFAPIVDAFSSSRRRMRVATKSEKIKGYTVVGVLFGSIGLIIVGFVLTAFWAGGFILSIVGFATFALTTISFLIISIKQRCSYGKMLKKPKQKAVSEHYGKVVDFMVHSSGRVALYQILLQDEETKKNYDIVVSNIYPVGKRLKYYELARNKKKKYIAEENVIIPKIVKAKSGYVTKIKD